MSLPFVSSSSEQLFKKKKNNNNNKQSKFSKVATIPRENTASSRWLLTSLTFLFSNLQKKRRLIVCTRATSRRPPANIITFPTQLLRTICPSNSQMPRGGGLWLIQSEWWVPAPSSPPFLNLPAPPPSSTATKISINAAQMNLGPLVCAMESISAASY